MIANASFELAAALLQQGAPADWVVTTAGTGEDAAVFAGDMAAGPAGTESFDHGWGTRNPQSIAPLTAVESRETETMATWVTLTGAVPLNQLSLFLAVAEAATFDSHTSAVELFEVWAAGGDTDQTFESTELESGLIETFSWSSFVGLLEVVETNDFSNGDAAELFLPRVRQEVLVDLDINRLYRKDMANFVGGPGEVYTITTTDALPTPLRETRLYYVIDTAGPYVGVSEQPGGDYVAITDVGSGTQYLYADPDEFWTYVM
jgi:hypothetical protein